METIYFYLLLVAVSIASCFVGFYVEVLQGNIRHLENGRKPNAGAALLPTILVIPIVYFGVVYGLNTLKPDLGWYTITGWYLMLGIYWLYIIPKFNKQFKMINTE